MLEKEYRGLRVRKEAEEEENSVVYSSAFLFWLFWVLAGLFLFLVGDRSLDRLTDLFLSFFWLAFGMALWTSLNRILRLLMVIHHHQIYPVVSHDKLVLGKIKEKMQQIERLAR
jgi:hypothetical protein